MKKLRVGHSVIGNINSDYIPARTLIKNAPQTVG